MIPRRDRDADEAGLGRGRLTRTLPVLLQAPQAAPPAAPFVVSADTTPNQLLRQVLFAAKRYTVPGAVCSIIEQVSTVSVPVVVGLAIDRALAPGDRRQLYIWLLALLAIGLARIFAARSAQQFGVYASQSVQHRLRATLSRAVLHPTSPAARQPEASVVSVMTNDVTRLGVNGLLVHPIGEVVAIAFIACSLFTISWPLGLTVSVGGPLAVWFMGKLSAQFTVARQTYFGQLAATVSRAADLVAGYRIIRGIGAEGEAARRYRSASAETLDGALRTNSVLGRFLLGGGSVSGLFVVLVASMAGWFAIRGQISVGEFITAVGLAQALLPQMQFLTGNAVPALASAEASSARVLGVLQELDTEPTKADVVADSVVGHVSRVDLVIDGRSESVSAGEILGIQAAGRTATQIVDAALHPTVDAGTELRIDGRPAWVLDPSVYRCTTTVSPHHAALFSGSIADTFEMIGAPAELRSRALYVSACDDFVHRGIDGLGQQVGETGNRLSGGQRQRVALARALATDAPVLMLHDPTTAVDSKTEVAIAERLRDMRSARITIILTSSPALLGVCDRVISI